MNMTDKEIEIADITDYESRVNKLVREILQKAFELKELKPFFGSNC